MYTRILVATGGSAWSDAAVAVAIDMAARTGAHLHVLTVLGNAGMSINPYVMGDAAGIADHSEHEGQAALDRAATQAQQTGVACETISAWGNVPDAILQTAANERCDLIMVGSRGLSGLKRLMLGSITNAVAARASQPVCVIKRSVSLIAPLGRRVLVPTGGSPWPDAAVEHALLLAQTQQLELCFLHVDRGGPQRGEDPAASEGKNRLVVAEAHAAMAGVAYEGVLASGPVTETILETAAEKQCDAIILGSRGLTGWKRLRVGSIVNGVTAKATVPVFLIKRFFDA